MENFASSVLELQAVLKNEAEEESARCGPQYCLCLAVCGLLCVTVRGCSFREDKSCAISCIELPRLLTRCASMFVDSGGNSCLGP